MFEPDVRRVDYERYTNRQLATVPLVVLALALLVEHTIAVRFARRP